MSSRDVCSLCETNYVSQDDARCGICAACEAVLDEEYDRRTNSSCASVVLAVDPSVALPKNPPIRN